MHAPHVAQARDQVLMKLAVLNELRLAIGSFAPCEVVMEGCTRVLPLVALPVARPELKMSLAGDGEGEFDGEVRGRPGVSPNRHPEAHSGAANVKVIRSRWTRLRMRIEWANHERPSEPMNVPYPNVQLPRFTPK